MRKYILIALLLVTIGVGISFLLIPTEREISELQARDAVQIDLGNIDIEGEYAQGRRSFPIIDALVQKRIEEGNRPEAIALLEEYVSANPKNIHARKRLAEQYQLAGEYLKYNAQLEAIAEADPTEENLKILSDIYNAEKSYPKQIEILKRIIEITDGKNPVYFSDLATIQMVEGRSEEALVTVEELRAKHPDYKSYAITRIYVSALAAKGEQERAARAAEEWITQHEDAKEIADFVNILHYTGEDAARAIRLVTPRLNLITTSPDLALAYINANISAGRQDHAYEILVRIDDAGTMPTTLYPVYLELALNREDIPAAKRIVAQLDPNSFSEVQALNMVELARGQDKAILDALIARFEEPGVLDTRPVLASVIGIITNAKDQDERIAAALLLELDSTQRLRLAEACARAQKNVCFNEIVKKFPPIDQMTPAQVAEFAQLHIVANRASDIVDAVGVKARENPVYETNHAHLRLASAAGRSDIMDIWLTPNAQTASLSQLQEYFYIANDRGHANIATKIARILYDRDPSPTNRDIMIASLLKAKREKEALPLLREQIKTDGASDALYVSTLSKLARRDKEARSELTDYALSALEADRGTNQQQLNYTYALINHGKRRAVAPIIRAKAKSVGGEWRKIHAQLNPPKGSGKAVVLTRAQYLKLAHKPGITAANKRQIAFNLFNMGHRADAALLFEDLAHDKNAKSQEVQDLLFIWGGTLDERQFAWLESRAQNANAFDKRDWQDMVNNYASDTQIMHYVANDSAALYHQNIRQRYFRLLANYHGADVFDVAMRDWVNQTTDATALHDYAAAAAAFGYPQAAARTYERIVMIAPDDKRALTRLSSAHFARGQFIAARPLLDRAIAIRANNAEDANIDAEAYFYRAELFKRDKQRESAENAYTRVVNLTLARFEREGSLPLDAETRLNASLFHIGRQQQARAGFDFLLKNDPTNKGLLADYMALLIEYDYLSDALKIANQYDENSVLLRKHSRLQGTSSDINGVRTSADGHSITLSFNKPIDGASPLKSGAKPQWLKTARADYDTLTVAAKPGYMLRYMPTSSDTFEIVSSPEEDARQTVARAQALRLQLLYAQVEQKLGQTEKARTRLAQVEQYYPNEPELIASRAAIESADGNVFEALDIIRRAQNVAPGHEDYNRFEESLSKAGGRRQFVKIDHEYRSFGDNNEEITTLSGAVRTGDRGEIGMVVRNDFLNSKNIRRGDTGQIGNFNVTRQQAELYAAYYLDGGARAQFSVFANNDTAGAGLYYGFKNQLGNTEFIAEYHRPYWDFVEAVMDEATRDRIGVRHIAQLAKGTSLGIETSVNRYNSNAGTNLLNTTLTRINLVQTLQEKGPYIAIGYGFDGEYLFGHREQRTDGGGNIYHPFPLISREVHLVSGTVRHDFSPQTQGLLTAGYAYDRIGLQDGPVVEGRLTHDVTDDIEIGARARYGVQTNGDNADAINAGAHLQYNF
jgi:tetratricopeptide (TPR) repeat protein